MSEHTPTLLIVYLHPDKDENACYHIDETLTTAGIAYSLIVSQEERRAGGIVESTVLKESKTPS